MTLREGGAAQYIKDALARQSVQRTEPAEIWARRDLPTEPPGRTWLEVEALVRHLLQISPPDRFVGGPIFNGDNQEVKVRQHVPRDAQY
mmetsp:Transcript_42690/g.77120  ORF Transcript_42690/g.77120 Transcript_42690/m.77120 type:complete len:89 (-) Transcript_42690:101-367(-)